jgi:hypothetical protein
MERVFRVGDARVIQSAGRMNRWLMAKRIVGNVSARQAPMLTMM